MSDLDLTALEAAAKAACPGGVYDMPFTCPSAFDVLALISRIRAAEAENARLRAVVVKAVDALQWASAAAKTIDALEVDWGEPISDRNEIGRIDESRGSPSFRIQVGHLRAARTVAAEIEEALK